MAEKVDDGGPAYPCPSTVGPRDGVVLDCKDFGMTLRDYFAAAALTGWIVSLSMRRGDCGYTDAGAAEEAARLSGISADAMLSERKRLAQEGSK